MEAQFKSESIMSLLATTKLVFYTVLEFLNPDELKNLYLALKQAPHNNHAPVLQIIQAYLYIRVQMMNTDRSFYFAVYDSSRFRNFEKSHLAFLVQSNNKFNQLFQCRQENNKFMEEILQQADCPQVLNQIQQISIDPQVPMLRLLRETVGVGCTSTFQNFLLSSAQDLYSMPLEEYPNLSEFYQKRTQQSYINQFLKIGRSKGRHPDFQKVKKLRLAAYLIKIGETATDELANNQMHNFLVGLFSMADQMVQASSTYIGAIEDPFHKLLQFCLRYSIYRNFVLSIQVTNLLTQEKFSFVFELYSSLYEDYFQSEAIDIPPFSFWRPAYTKWFLGMSKFHKELTQTYNYYLLSLRHKNINESIQSMREDLRPEHYSVMRNWIQSTNIQTLVELGKPINKEVIEIIEEELIYCVNEYNDIQLDLSIDEVTVNWCGYTKQKLAHPFLQFQKKVVEATKLFYDRLFEIGGSPELMSFIVDADLAFVQNNQYYKFKIMSSIAEVAKSYLQVPIYSKFKLSNLDQQIKTYNQNAGLIEEIPCQLSRQLHQIPPPPEQEIMRYIEKPSFETMGASDEQSDLSDYRSDSELELPEYKKEELAYFMQNDESLEFMHQCQGTPQNFSQTPKCL